MFDLLVVISINSKVVEFISSATLTLHGSTLTRGNGSLVHTPVGFQCFNLFGYVLFQALADFLLAKG